MNEFLSVGKSVPYIDAKDKSRGQAIYTFDMKLPGMLVGKFLRSAHAHAIIKNINTAKALKLKGVHAIITRDDTHKIKYGSNSYFFPFTDDQYPLATDKVRYIGEEVAAVCAETEEIAEEAIKLIEVEYEILPAVFDPILAMKPDAPKIQSSRNNVAVMIPALAGDVDKGFAHSDYICEAEFKLPSQAHVSLEPHVALAKYEEGKITLWASTQAPFRIRENLAKTLKMDQKDIRVIKPHVGGGFGGKLEMLPLDFCACLLAKKSGRPVKFCLSREEEFLYTRRKHPMIFKLKAGASRDGKIQAISGEVIADGGAYCSYGPTVVAAAIMRIGMVYKLENVKIFGYRVYTNNPISGAIRGFGGAQSGFAFESLMDMLACGIGMDGAEFRMRNATDPNFTAFNGMEITSNGLKDCIKLACEKTEWKKLKQDKNKEGFGIGIAIAADVMGSKMYKSHESAGTVIRIEEDGSVIIFTGSADIGQGSNTTMAIIAAEVLGIDLSRIRVVAADTETTPFDTGSFASRVTFISGNATKRAAEDARKQIDEIVAKHWNLPIERIVHKKELIVDRDNEYNQMSFLDAVKLCYSFDFGKMIIGRGVYNPPTKPVDLRTGKGNVSAGYSFEAQIVSVHVDKETGKVTILDITDAHDIGRAINPIAVEGQIEGSLYLGIGYTLWEDLKFKDGIGINPTLFSYRVPRSTDMPPINSIFVETDDKEGPYGAKGMAESALLPTSAAVANAIYDAVGVRITSLPITPEKILQALKNKPV
ncbi:MAG: xanthine dehydrogenase family protein molybdopterin-binding subunit [Candidatus Omnitrophota bacterium]